jgi:hypothetical protein
MEKEPEVMDMNGAEPLQKGLGGLIAAIVALVVK